MVLMMNRVVDQQKMSEAKVMVSRSRRNSRTLKRAVGSS